MSDPIFVEAVERLREVQIRLNNGGYSAHLEPSLTERQEIIASYQPLFARENLSNLTEADFRAFLMFRNNRHWSGLHRLGPRLCRDMERLRSALALLLYGEQPMAERYNLAIKSADGLGRAVATAILLVVYPDSYGVWNAKSEAGLKRLNLWFRFDRGESEGNRYTKINDLLLRLCDAMKVDLWTLDALWHYLLIEEGEDESTIEEIGEESQPPITATHAESRFGLERHLQEFLWDNWEQTELGKEWTPHTEAGDERAGYEYPCGVGRIDILARHRQTKAWLVVELKRDQTSDGTVGQVLRYMGWVQDHLAEAGEKVKGLIICREWDKNLYYAVKFIPSVDVMLYRVHFSLQPAPHPKNPK